MSKYQRKTIYFKSDNADIYEIIENIGKGASDYICDLIRQDVSNEKENFDKILMKELKALRNEIKHLKNDLTEIKGLKEDLEALKSVKREILSDEPVVPEEEEDVITEDVIASFLNFDD